MVSESTMTMIIKNGPSIVTKKRLGEGLGKKNPSGLVVGASAGKFRKK